MTPRYWFMLLALASSQTAQAVDSADASPYDANPACMSTTTDSSTGNCIIQTEGTPRHLYPPRGPSAPGRNAGGAMGSGATTGMAPAAPSTVKTAPHGAGK